jgi:hypothetical protein
MKTYPFPLTDDLGPLPQPPMRMRITPDHNELFLDHFIEGEWIALARRQDRKWLPLFSNIEVGETFQIES